MSVRTKPDFTRQLPSGRLIRLDMALIIPLLSRAKREANPAVLDFIDHFAECENYFRVRDLGQGPQTPDRTQPPKAGKPQGKRDRSWTLREVLRGESALTEEDVKALDRSLIGGPMAGWMTKMVNAVVHFRDALRDQFAQHTEYEFPSSEVAPARNPRRFPPARG